MIILCDKCQKYIYPEVYDPYSDCKSPSVIVIDDNFHRKRKCRYYQKITYERGILRLKEMLKFIFLYVPGPKRSRLLKMTQWKVKMLQYHINNYLEFRDFVFKDLNPDEGKENREKIPKKIKSVS